MSSTVTDAACEGPRWGLTEIAAYLHLSPERTARRLQACGLVAERADTDEFPAQVIIEARDQLCATQPAENG